MKILMVKITVVAFLSIFFLNGTAIADSYKLADSYFIRGKSLYKQGKYIEAGEMFEKSIKAEKATPEPRLAKLAFRFGWSGFVYKYAGQYDKVLKYYGQALAINRKLNKKGEIAANLSNIGWVYDVWGQHDKALEQFQEALTINRKLDKAGAIAVNLTNMGVIYWTNGQLEKALRHFQESLAIDRRLKKEGAVAIVLTNIGLVYGVRGQYDKAIAHFKEALAIDRKHGQNGGIAADLNNIGNVYWFWGKNEEALKYYQEALSVNKMLGEKRTISTVLNNIGTIYYRLRVYSKAIPHFVESIALKEKLRKTATGDARRDYLASVIRTYQYLISSYIRDRNATDAFATTEISHARLLTEKLAEEDTKIKIPSAAAIQKDLNNKTAVLVYANTDWGKEIAQITLTKGSISSREASKESFISDALRHYKEPITVLETNQRGIKLVAAKKKAPLQIVKDDNTEKKSDFEKIINYYRSLLGNASSGGRGIRIVERDRGKQEEKIKAIGRMLYDLLIKPNEEALRGKEELIIVPDGLLAFIPFELLVDEEGRYLVEKYRITYTQSMGIYRQIQKRQYAKNRKPLLAFGGAVYDEVFYKADMIDNTVQLASLQKNTHAAFDKQRSIRASYAALGIGDWDNLPGTLSEVNAISKVIKKTTLFTGEQVTENRIKTMSENGDLSQYKVIHFATHGLVLPAMPELSAVVLSQFKEERGGEDGYLRMGEIAKLKIQADFVNLSACETGLGKIYNGEGVVGLTQSFLIAGAKGLSVSLWNVQDDSTAQFMTAMYQLVEEKGYPYADAMTVVKRRFLRGDFGDKYKAPYYWAPFVYYGGGGNRTNRTPDKSEGFTPEQTLLKNKLKVPLETANLTPNIGKILKGIKSSDGRYVGHGDGTVTDTNTGLMWTKKDSYPDLGKCLDWNTSKRYIRNLTTGGYRDWRFPTVEELKGIYEEAKVNKMSFKQSILLHLDSIFADGAAYYYWSSETTGSCCARLVNFYNGHLSEFRRDICSSVSVRSVRGGE